MILLQLLQNYSCYRNKTNSKHLKLIRRSIFYLFASICSKLVSVNWNSRDSTVPHDYKRREYQLKVPFSNVHRVHSTNGRRYNCKIPIKHSPPPSSLIVEFSFINLTEYDHT